MILDLWNTKIWNIKTEIPTYRFYVYGMYCKQYGCNKASYFTEKYCAHSAKKKRTEEKNKWDQSKRNVKNDESRTPNEERYKIIMNECGRSIKICIVKKKYKKVFLHCSWLWWQIWTFNKIKLCGKEKKLNCIKNNQYIERND